MDIHKIPIVKFCPAEPTLNLSIFRKLMKSICILLLVACYLLLVASVHADELIEIETQIKQLEERKKLSEDATKPLEGEVLNLEKQIAQTLYAIAKAEDNLVILSQNIISREKDFAYQSQLLETRVEQFYKFLRSPTQIFYFFASSNSSKAIKQISYQKSVAAKDKEIILKISKDLSNLESDKVKLEESQKTLKNLKQRLATQQEFFEGEIAKAKDYQKALKNQIAQLSARQQEIINARSGGFTVNIGDSELADDYNASIKGFRESAPSGYFGVFSFGAYTRRKGMSQYGALGHVKSQGWNYEQLLKYYYPGISLNKVDNSNITVNGTNSYSQSFNNENYSLEDYLKHIYEVPSSWPAEILKAQAIAARSYAYGKATICPGQQCQEFKREENADSWKQAVKDTEGIIMTGGPGNWQYSSTTGGWINGLGWDTQDRQGGSNFIDKSFEKIAGSPWVYKAWYTQTYRNNSDKCGRSNAWLSPQEMADIVNAAIALKTPDIDISRITPVTTSCWDGNPYSMDELRNLVAGNGGISSANSVTVSQGDGTTNTVTINGVSLSGADFKKAFNLRAPGRLSIPQKGFSFFNIEKK